jgi:hypothetical protein
MTSELYQAKIAIPFRVVIIGGLLFLLLAPGRPPLGLEWVAFSIVITTGGSLLIVWQSISRGISVIRLCGNFIYLLTTLILLFSIIYLHYGTAKYFNMPLTHLDAVYFTVGTLSTAGTGNISATSELIRGIQTVQFIVDLIYTLIAVALVLARITSSGNDATGRPSPEQMRGLSE